MDGRNVLSLVAVGLLVCTGTAAAATPCAVDAVSVADPAIVVRRDASGLATIELADNGVSVRKAYQGGSVKTTITAGRQQIVIALNGGEVAITSGGRTWKAATSNLETLEEAAAVLRNSAVVRAARALLDRTPLRPDSIGGNAMLLTKALLGSISGDSASSAEHQRWAQSAARRPQIVRAMQQGMGPGDCWDMYSDEALRIASNYVDCGQACSWKGFWCLLSCGFIYDIRAEGAFMWYMKCNGGFYLNG
jgi:hypothetical protein